MGQASPGMTGRRLVEGIMHPVHLFEATIADKETGLSAHFISVRRAYLPELASAEIHSQEISDFLIKRLGLHPIIEISPEKVRTAVSALLSYSPQLSGRIADTSSRDERHAIFSRLFENPEILQISRSDADFAEYLTFAPVVPIERSPLEGLSLDQIVQTGGTGVGAYIGIVVAGATPLLFITVPAGMIICGAAAGVGMGLFKGLSDRISQLIRGS